MQKLKIAENLFLKDFFQAGLDFMFALKGLEFGQSILK